MLLCFYSAGMDDYGVSRYFWVSFILQRHRGTPCHYIRTAHWNTLLAAGYVSVRNHKEEPCLVSSDEWFLRKYSPFSCKIFTRDIFSAFYGNFRPCFRHISLKNISPRNLSFGNNNMMSRNEALQSCFQRKYYWVPAVI
jgi:hypothetical protein